MIMDKIMSNNKDDVNTLLNGKFGLKFGGERHILAVKAIADAHFSSSIVALTSVYTDYKDEI